METRAERRAFAPSDEGTVGVGVAGLMPPVAMTPAEHVSVLVTT